MNMMMMNRFIRLLVLMLPAVFALFVQAHNAPSPHLSTTTLPNSPSLWPPSPTPAISPSWSSAAPASTTPAMSPEAPPPTSVSPASSPTSIGRYAPVPSPAMTPPVAEAPTRNPSSSSTPTLSPEDDSPDEGSDNSGASLKYVAPVVLCGLPLLFILAI